MAKLPVFGYMVTGAKLLLVNFLALIGIALYNYLSSLVAQPQFSLLLVLLSIPVILAIQGYLARTLFGWK